MGKTLKDKLIKINLQAIAVLSALVIVISLASGFGIKAQADSSDYYGEFWNLPTTNPYDPTLPINITPDYTENDQAINFNWDETSPDPGVIGIDNFGARWTKNAYFNSGTYEFTATVDDGVRVFLDGNLIIDQWTGHGGQTFNDFENITAGYHNIEVDYFQDGGGAEIDFNYYPAYPASGVIGQGDYTSTNSDSYDANPDGLNNPIGMAVDSSNHLLYVADTQDNRILIYKLNSDGTIASTNAVAVLGQPDLYSQVGECGGHPQENYLCDPYAVTLDTVDHHIFVSDTGNSRILEFNLESDGLPESPTELPIAFFGTSDYSTSGCSLTTDDNTICNPEGIAIDANNHVLYVTDQQDSRVVGYNLTSNNTPSENDPSANYVFGQPDFTSNNCQTPSSVNLCYPTDVSIDPIDNQLIVTDSDFNRILFFSLNSQDQPTQAIDESASYEIGEPDMNTNFADGGANQMGNPLSAQIDPTNHLLYVDDFDNNRIEIFQLTSNNQPTFGYESASYVIGQPDFNTYSTGTSQNQISSPNYVTIDPNTQKLYISDTYNQRVLVFDVSNLSDSTDGENADGLIGQSNYALNDVWGRTFPNNSGLSFTTSTAIDPINHLLYVADVGNFRVLMYKLTNQNQLEDQQASAVIGQVNFTTAVSQDSQNGLGEPFSIYLDTQYHKLFVSDVTNSEVLEYNLNNDNTPTSDSNEFASAEVGAPNFTTPGCTGAPSISSFCGNFGITLNPNTHQLFVVDNNNSRVLVYNLDDSDNIISQNASYVIGSNNFNSNSSECGDGSVTDNTFCNPNDLTVDPSTNYLYVSDSDNNRILVFNLNNISNGMAASYVIGQSNFSTADSNLTQNGLNYPSGIIAPGNGLLYVSDINNARVLIYNLNNLSDGENASAVIGPPDFNTRGEAAGTPAGNTFNLNFSELAYDSTDNRLIVPDDSDSRVLSFDLSKINTASLDNGSIGHSYYQDISSTTFGNYSYSIESGNLPPGLSINSASGAIQGAPTAKGNYNFRLMLTDTLGGDDTIGDGAYIDFRDLSIDILGNTSYTKKSSNSTTATTNQGSTNADTTSTNILILNSIPSFVDGSGVNETAAPNSTYYFCLTTNNNCSTASNNLNSIQVISVNPQNNSVEISLNSGSIKKTIYLNQSSSIKINNSNYGIIASLTSINANQAGIKFKLASYSQSVPKTLSSTVSKKSHNYWWVITIVLLIILLFIITKKKRSNADQNN